MTKRAVYLAQVNHAYGDNFFLPYSVGLLQAYAQKDQVLRDAYEFQPLIFRREPITDVLTRMAGKPPDVLGISCYIWNTVYSLALATRVKAAFPGCLVVAGGPNVPVREVEQFFDKNPFIDAVIHYEGERQFTNVLSSRLKGQEPHRQVLTGNRETDLTEIPSPYLTGIFDPLLAQNPTAQFHLTQECHRGCPYACTMCDWGSSVFTKVRKFDDARLLKELDWAAEHKIELIYNADANFGMFARDADLVRHMAALKKKSGYPKKFRAAYAKNSNERVYEIAKLLHQADMNKGITLSFQSMDDRVLEIIKRKNIKIQDFKALMSRYQADGIATYSELILGLPGETYDSFANGLNLLLECGQHESAQIYTCEVLPNSEMNDPEYKTLHEIKTVHGPIPMFHGTPSDDPHTEQYELITATKTMSEEDWLKAQLFAWAVQTFHCLGLTRALAVALKGVIGLSYRSFYERLLRKAEATPWSLVGFVYEQAKRSFLDLRAGKNWGVVQERFGNVIWPPEEIAYLSLIAEKGKFYGELDEWMAEERAALGKSAFRDLLTYQKAIIVDPHQVLDFELSMDYDWRAILAAIYAGQSVTPRFEAITYRIRPERVFVGKLDVFAREVCWYGRKGGKFLNTNIQVITEQPPHNVQEDHGV